MLSVEYMYVTLTQFLKHNNSSQSKVFDKHTHW